jgi:uncharacterized protein (UPF0333 family)
MIKLALFLILLGLSGALVIATYVLMTLVEGLRSTLQAHAKADAAVHNTKRLAASTNGGTAAA